MEPQRKRPFVLFLAILMLNSSNAQESQLQSIDLHISVIEQLKGAVKRVGNATLDLIGLGEYTTDANGDCELSAPIKDFNRYDSQLDIQVKVRDYDVISPYRGIMQVEISVPETEMDIMVIGRDVEQEYRDQINTLIKKLEVTEKKNSLSLKRMNAMNNSLLASMKQNEMQKTTLENTIENLNEKVISESAENQSLLEDLQRAKSEMNALRLSLQTKEDELFVALEERYLRQQNYHKAISADLNDFLIHVKDVHDLLQNLDKYFRPGQYPDYSKTYNSTLTAYNNILEKINENHPDYIHGIERYWGSPLIIEQLEDTFGMLFDQLHHPKLKPAINEINGHIRKNKPRKATKLAHEVFHDLNPLILNLEKSVNRSLDML